jgi:Cu(I)/Ag(I) efflux system membrane protein CusA/SilA
MIGGMVSSTVLTLVVIPAIYALVKGLGLPRAVVRPAIPAVPAHMRMGETHDA